MSNRKKLEEIGEEIEGLRLYSNFKFSEELPFLIQNIRKGRTKKEREESINQLFTHLSFLECRIKIDIQNIKRKIYSKGEVI